MLLILMKSCSLKISPSLRRSLKAVSGCRVRNQGQANLDHLVSRYIRLSQKMKAILQKRLLYNKIKMMT